MWDAVVRRYIEGSQRLFQKCETCPCEGRVCLSQCGHGGDCEDRRGGDGDGECGGDS